MKVLLTADVVKLGRIGDVVDVKPGYARNYLIPQGFATLATEGALKQAENLKRTAEKHRARELADAQAFANVIKSLVLRFERKVGERGRLYGSVTSADIAERIEAVIEAEEEIEKRKILLHEPIRQLGNYEVEIRIHPDVPAFVQVEVVGEEGETAADFIEEEEVAEPAVDVAGPQPTAEY
ncbi:MAG: 50S ribosomal protein L9 [Chloroflexota bacterium]|nr:50S ribosomal protein L9 [Chloroflexota bacterium]